MSSLSLGGTIYKVLMQANTYPMMHFVQKQPPEVFYEKSFS